MASLRVIIVPVSPTVLAGGSHLGNASLPADPVGGSDFCGRTMRCPLNNALVALTAILLTAPWAEASKFCAAEGVEAANGVVRLARRWDRAIDESFETGLGACQVFNYNENLTLSFSTARWGSSEPPASTRLTLT